MPRRRRRGNGRTCGAETHSHVQHHPGAAAHRGDGHRSATYTPTVHPALRPFHPAVRRWFSETFGAPTSAQVAGWQPIVRGDSTLLLAPTGSGKTLAAFLAGIDRLLFRPEPDPGERLKLVYVSPLKALGVDVEKNLRLPLAGIRELARRDGHACRDAGIAVRSGDTPSSERARFARKPSDILITTPESLYLLLTSDARRQLASVETVIIDEIHSLAATKRGTHLFASLERLEALRPGTLPLQRIGLSATQRPLGEIARLLGGGEVGADGTWQPRPVTIVDAGAKRTLELRIELAPRDADEPGRSIWPSLHPRLVELVRAHRSTMIFANSRRLAERLAAALNETAGEEIALAHHGSLAKERRVAIEDRLKRGELPAIVATSSLELGIDMGAVDLVVQIEAPPSVASGLQRIGRAGHSVGAVSRGVVLPKYRGDLLAAAATARRMLAGEVEETAYVRNPLDVLAQQIVAMVSTEPWNVDELFVTLRRAAPFAELSRSAFEGVLDLLSGRYPSDELATLRPRVTWDRVRGTLSARSGARRVAVLGGGTIPDRGLYAVFLSGESSVRVGELDEEMVFESRPGDVFLLGASSWRIDDITHDRVLVSPAPGEPGKMPFWHGDRPGRPAELGRAIGELARTLAAEPDEQALSRLCHAHVLDRGAAVELLDYVRAQVRATGEVPSDQALIVERFVDEVGDFRVCLLSPFGARVHAPLAMLVRARYREQTGTEIDVVWGDDGIAMRFPESDRVPDAAGLLPGAAEAEDRVVESVGQTSLFAARFRENAARALLLPRRFPGRRSPLWAQRRRASDLLRVAARHESFPILLETYRECLRDVFDLPALIDLLHRIETRELRVITVDSRSPSPFAASLLFSYVGNYIYDGDAPLAERRAHALGIDQARLRELLREAELRQLLDPEAIEQHERRLELRALPDADAVHDLLLAAGPLARDELVRRGAPAAALAELERDHRAFRAAIAGDERLAAAEDAARLRDALGVSLPPDLPQALLAPVADPLGDLVSRFARTHGPFGAERAAAALGAPAAAVHGALERLAAQGRVVEGEFLPRGRGREWCDADVLRALKRRSLARHRRAVEPVEPAAYARSLLEWQAIGRRRAGEDALLDSVRSLQGAALVASALESDVLAARVERYHPADLDRLCASGELVWRGLDPIGTSDGRIALYPADAYRLLAPPPSRAASELAGRVRERLAERGASFFADLLAATGAFPADLTAALWELVWAGEVTNDTLAPLRSLITSTATRAERGRARLRAGKRRSGPPGSEGRWSLLPTPADGDWPSETERRVALAEALLERYGVLTREAVAAEGVAGGFSAVYDVLKAMEDAGRVRRGYFVAGLGATQFALPGADDRLRSLRHAPRQSKAHLLAATDPANPYGASLPWPRSELSPGRSAGAHVVLCDGELLGWLARGDRTLITCLPASGPERERAASALARELARPVDSGQRRAVLIATIDGDDARSSPLGDAFAGAGFVATGRGLFKRASEPRSA